ARQMLDNLLEAMPHRRFHLIADGGYSTAEMGQGLDQRISYTGRMAIDAAIYEQPPERKSGQMGRPAMRGKKIPAPREWPELYPDLEKDWVPHPSEKGAWTRSCIGRWHNFMKGTNLIIVVIYRPAWKGSKSKKRQGAAVQAIFSTQYQSHPHKVIQTYQERWAVEIDIRDAFAFYGLGKAHLRKLKAIEALNQLRIIWAACRTVWFAQNLGQDAIKLNWLRPWYRKKYQPSQRDIAFELRNEMSAAGLLAIPVLGQGLDKSPANGQPKKARAA
ncbi:MAG: transposase, partial [Bacteroidota bacterium]